jgi:hypothetical protein
VESTEVEDDDHGDIMTGSVENYVSGNPDDVG